MKLFNVYDENGFYTETVECQENPVRPGSYIKPDLSTDLKLLPSIKGKWWKIVDNKWTHIDDNRGKVFYNDDGHPVLITSLEPIPASWSINKPQLTFDKLKQAKHLELITLVEDEIISGIELDVLGQVYYYPTKLTDQINLSGLVIESLLIPSDDPYKFWCRSNTGTWERLPHTKEQIQILGRAVAKKIKDAQNKYALKLDEVNSATLTSQLELIVW
jgi:hypothetical protein